MQCFRWFAHFVHITFYVIWDVYLYVYTKDYDLEGKAIKTSLKMFQHKSSF